MLNRNILRSALPILLTLVASKTEAMEQPAADRNEFFEARIRPILVEKCYECHNSSKNAEAGLALDHRAALLTGGDGGAIIVPGKPSESRLMAILRHEVKGVKMPQGGVKLGVAEIADFGTWISMGAPERALRPSAPCRGPAM